MKKPIYVKNKEKRCAIICTNLVILNPTPQYKKIRAFSKKNPPRKFHSINFLVSVMLENHTLLKHICLRMDYAGNFRHEMFQTKKLIFFFQPNPAIFSRTQRTFRQPSKSLFAIKSAGHFSHWTLLFFHHRGILRSIAELLSMLLSN